jgi:hypothetical protein
MFPGGTCTSCCLHGLLPVVLVGGAMCGWFRGVEMEIQEFEEAVTPPITSDGLIIPSISTPCISSKLNNSESLAGSDPITLETQQQEKRNLIKLKLLGVTEEEMKRWSALKKMGLSDEDFAIGAQYAAETSIQGTENLTKAEKLTGYTERQQKRCKAVKTLGTTEEEIIETRSKFLGQIGRDTHEQRVLPPNSSHTPVTEPGMERATSQFPKFKRWSSM